MKTGLRDLTDRLSARVDFENVGFWRIVWNARVSRTAHEPFFFLFSARCVRSSRNAMTLGQGICF
jgi:hypothetical protein